MESPARLSVEPRPDLGVLMGGVVVENGVDDLAGWDGALDSIAKADELVMAVTLHVAADDCAVEYIECGKERGRTVALMVVGHGSAPSRLHGQMGLGTVERLNLAFLVDAEHHGVGRWICMKADDVLHPGRERRIARKLECAKTVRTELMGAPDALYRTDRDADGLGHGGDGLVRRFVRRVGVGQGDDAIDHGLAERLDARRAGTGRGHAAALGQR